MKVSYKKVLSVLQSLGEYKRRGEWFNFKCPFHGGNRYNFGVHPSSGRYKCLGCPAEGSILSLYDGTPSSTHENFDELREALEAGPDISDTEELASSAAGRGFELESWWSDNFTELKHGTGSKIEACMIGYLESRGTDFAKYGVGFLRETILRVTFPFRIDGKLVFYQSRLWKGGGKLKTLNPKPDPWYRKNDVLWCYDTLEERIVLCEGIFDAISVHNSGLSATCLLGKTVSERQIYLLRKKNVKEIYVMLDQDAIPDAWALAKDLHWSGFNVRVCTWSGVDKKDPGDCTKKEILNLVQSAEEYSDFKAMQDSF